MSRQHGSNAARISRHVAAGLAGLVLVVPVAAAHADASGPAASVLLIANSGYAALPKLPGCVPAMRSLSDRLRAKGANVSEQFDAAGPSLRAAIGSFDLHLAQGQKAAIVYCGYVAADADKLFILPVGATSVQPADLPRQAIIARTLSRVLSGHDAVLVAEMHPAPGAPDLANAVQGLREASAMSTYLDLRTVDGAGSPQIDAFAGTVDRSAGWPYQAGAATGTQQPQATASAKPDAAAGPTRPDATTVPPKRESGSTGPASAAAPAVSAAGETSSASSGASASGAAPPAVEAAKPVPATPVPARTVAAKPVPARPAAVASSTGTATGTGTPKPGPFRSGTPDEAGSSGFATPNQKRPQVAASDALTGSPSIRHLQVSLLALGFYNNKIDGFASPATQAAVRAYQKSLKHPETGFLTYGESKELGKVGARR